MNLQRKDSGSPTANRAGHRMNMRLGRMAVAGAVVFVAVAIVVEVVMVAGLGFSPMSKFLILSNRTHRIQNAKKLQKH